MHAINVHLKLTMSILLQIQLRRVDNFKWTFQQYNKIEGSARVEISSEKVVCDCSGEHTK
jgi:hypothetical protein